MNILGMWMWPENIRLYGADDSDELRTDLSPDRLHLNEQGYREWRRVLGEALAAKDHDDDQVDAGPAAAADRAPAADFQV